MWFLAIGAAINKSLREKDLLTWFQILIECVIIGLEVKLEIGWVNGSLEHNKAAREVDSTEALSRIVHAGAVVSLLNQYSNALMLAAQ